MFNKLSKNQLTMLWIIQGLVLSSSALARWDHRQAEKLDRFDDLKSEYYNDVISYRAPWSWDDMDKGKQVQIRTYAGSLNQKEFYFGQKALVQTDDSSPFQLKYESVRLDDRCVALEEDALALSYKPVDSDFKYSLLADGFGDKAYSDLGLGVDWKKSSSSFFVKLWSIDPFFELKKLDKTEHRSYDNYSLNLGISQRFNDLVFDSSFLYETPIEWRRDEKNIIYKYQKQESKLGLTLDGKTIDYYITENHLWLREALGPQTYIIAPGYSYIEDTVELGLKGTHGRSTSQLAVLNHSSNIDYQGLSPSLEREAPSKDKDLLFINRKEYSLFATWHSPWSEASNHYQQWGFYINRINLAEKSYNVYTEAKIQWAFDWAIGNQGRFLLGTTWNLDDFTGAFQKHGNITKPWGGGFTQIMINF